MPHTNNRYHYTNGTYYRYRDRYLDPYPHSRNGYKSYPESYRYSYSKRDMSSRPHPYLNHHSIQKESEAPKELGPMPVKLRRAVLIIGMIPMFTNAFLVGAPFWRSTMSWYGAARITDYWAFEGLFLSCVRQGYQALSQCYTLYPIMGTVEGEVGVRSGKDYNIYPNLTSFRALMIIGMVFSVAGVVCSVLGMRCATVIDEDSKQKRRIILAGGASHLFAGLFTGICVSWYAGEVIYEFYAISYQSVRIKFTLGACIYVGWISMVISLVCGLLMTCWIFCNKSDDDYIPPTLTEIHPVAQPLYGNEVLQEEPVNYFPSRRYSGSRRDSRQSNHDKRIGRSSRSNSRHYEMENHSSSRRGSKQTEDYPLTSRKNSQIPNHTSHRGSLFQTAIEEKDLEDRLANHEKSSKTSGSNSGQDETGFV